VVLPATAWPEKDGTVTNTNRQVQMGRKALDAPGEARPDWWTTQEIAKRMGLDWAYTHPSEVFAEMKQAMPSLDNITWDRLEAENAVTYPCAAPDQPGADIVFGDRFPNESGLGKFVPAAIIPPDEQPDADYPMVLTTGRQLEHWHTGAMTRRATQLDAIEPEPTAGLAPAEIRRMGIAPGDMVRVETRRGVIELAARSDSGIPEGVVFVPFAYVEASANLLTNAALDPFGKIPEFKYCAARVAPAARAQAAE
jgi:formate dehydrogenase major subunit